MMRQRSRFALFAAAAVFAATACKADSRPSSFPRPADDPSNAFGPGGTAGDGSSNQGPGSKAGSKTGSNGSKGGDGSDDSVRGLEFGYATPGRTATTLAPIPAAPVTAATTAVLTARGVVVPLVRLNSDGSAVVATPCQKTVTLKKKVTGIGQVDALIDAGHGGDDPGAIGHNKLREKDLNLAIAQLAVDAINASGAYTALLTRTDDYDMTIGARHALVAAIKPRAFVSVHSSGDAGTASPDPGTDVYYQHGSVDSRRLAGIIYEEVIGALTNYDEQRWRARSDKGVKERLDESGQDYFELLRQPAGVASALTELALLSHPDEAELLAQAEVQRALSLAVARGVDRYFRTKETGSGYVKADSGYDPGPEGTGTADCTDPVLE